MTPLVTTPPVATATPSIAPIATPPTDAPATPTPSKSPAPGSGSKAGFKPGKVKLKLEIGR